MLNILADKNIYKLQDFLTEDVSLKFFDPSNSLPDLENIDVLLVRTVSALNKSTIPEIPASLKVIGTASSGSDHIDCDYFEEHGVKVFDAKGCNANAVGEYVITCLLLWGIKKEKALTDYTVGVVGAGAAGSAVIQQMQKFGIDYVSYDPPKAELDDNYESSSLEELMSCNILTFHVPLTKAEKYPTHHWLNEDKLQHSKFELIINAARGGVIDETSLLKSIKKGNIQDVIVDVWENEPDFNIELSENTFIATPHIAGYSEQAKLNASKFIVEKIADYFEFDLASTKNLYANKKLDLADLKYSAYELLLRLNPLREYDADLREIADRSTKSELFRKLRVDRPYRFEYPFIELDSDLINHSELFKKLGILGK